MQRRTLLKLMGLFATNAVLGGCGASADPSIPSEAPRMSTSTQPSTVSVNVFNSSGKLVGPIDEPKVVKTDAEWKKQLTPTQYQIARGKGTERAFCGTLLDNHTAGVYSCICCGLPLFSSDSKFNSGTGWPSFFAPVSKSNVIEHEDNAYGMSRTEILCIAAIAIWVTCSRWPASDRAAVLCELRITEIYTEH